MRSLLFLPALIGITRAACPYLTGELHTDNQAPQHNPHRRDETPMNDGKAETEEFLSQFYINDNGSFITTDVGGPIEEQNTLRVGQRGPTLLEDFIFRQKIQHFDHERVSVHCQWNCGPRSDFFFFFFFFCLGS